MGSFWQDLRYGFRIMLKRPGPAVLSIGALALGLGLTTTMWSITYGALLRGLPFENDHELLHIERARPSRGIDQFNTPIHDFTEWSRAQRSFEGLSGFYEGTVNVSGGDGRAERFEGAFVTPNTFRLLRIQPILGRSFTEEEARPGEPPVVMIGWDLWQQRFGGDSAVVGWTLRANGTTAEIIGVMPRGFEFATNSKLWLPLRLDPVALPWGQGQWVNVMGRLRPGVTMAQARQDLEAICLRIAAEHPEQNEGVVPLLEPFRDDYIGEEPQRMLWTMMGAVVGVLLIACSNVANLLLARAAARTKEVAVRNALGASRGRIVMQMLTEALALSAVGALLGTGLAWVGVRWFNNSIVDAEPPFWINISVDAPILGFVAGLTVLAALVAGIVPAIQTTRTNLHDVLKDESRGASSLRLGKFSRALVVAELALSCGLLVGAGFMIQSVVKFSNTDYGVPTRSVFTARVGLFETMFPDSVSRRTFWRDLEQRLAAMPGQRGVALMTVLPGLNGWTPRMQVEGRTYAEDRDQPTVRQVFVTPGYFPAFDLAALEGRLLSEGDQEGTLPVAVASRNFARAHFGAESPVGRRVRLGSGERIPWITIVGVVPDVWYKGNDGDPPAEVLFMPLAQGDFRFLSVAVASTGNPMAFAEPVRQAVMAINPDQPIYFVRTLAEAIRRSGWFYNVFGTLFTVFGVSAFVLAMIGVYGVMSFSVTHRTQEVGVRMALGAGAREVLRLFLRQGALQVGTGIVIGSGLALLLTKGLKIVMFQVDTRSPLMFALAGASLALAGLLATYLPARRATRVDPMVALRYE